MKKNKRVTDKEAIYRHLLTGSPITAVEAFKKYGMMRLSARIFDLRSEYGDGQIVTVDKVSPDGERFAEYRWDFKYSKNQITIDF